MPCIRCNQTVKFRDLLDVARDLGAEAMATGHYVQRAETPDGPQLLRAFDPARDQSYFLFATTRDQLDFLRFPLGGLPKPEVRRVAFCTGAGASMIGDARRAGADIYVTADMKYNDFMTPDKALTVADIGHFESEYCAIQILFDILSKNLITFAVRKSESSRNPVNYLV